MTVKCGPCCGQHTPGTVLAVSARLSSVVLVVGNTRLVPYWLCQHDCQVWSWLWATPAWYRTGCVSMTPTTDSTGMLVTRNTLSERFHRKILPLSSRFHASPVPEWSSTKSSSLSSRCHASSVPETLSRKTAAGPELTRSASAISSPQFVLKVRCWVCSASLSSSSAEGESALPAGR